MLNNPTRASAVTRDIGGQAVVHQVGRQVHADEYHLETADEEADRQQHVAAMAERLADRLSGGLHESVYVRMAALHHRRRQRRHERPTPPASQQRAVPAEVG